MESKVCSRSHGHPHGPRSRAMIETARSNCSPVVGIRLKRFLVSFSEGALCGPSCTTHLSCLRCLLSYNFLPTACAVGAFLHRFAARILFRRRGHQPQRACTSHVHYGMVVG